MRKKSVFLAVIIILGLAAAFLFLWTPPPAQEINYGAVFIQKHAENLGLDWRQTYLALLDDLKARDLKISAQWDLIEPQKGSYAFDDLDWQLDEAARRNAKIILTVGMKTSRWPECHLPAWAKSLDKAGQQAEILQLLAAIVGRYQDRPEIVAWQVENEPLFPFGECPWSDKEFLAKEVGHVRSLDHANRPIIISDSGEGSWWFEAAKIADIVSVTMYRGAYFYQIGRYLDYPLPPALYWFKKELVGDFFKKPVICGELQAEPWCKNQLYDCAPEEQKKTMDLARFQNNLDFATKTGLDTFYLWGAEWWYWMKTEQGDPSFWEEARKLFQ